MKLLVLWLHLLAAIVWVGGLIYQTHVLLPAARRSDPQPFLVAATRARPATWTAITLVVLTGFYNVTQLGSIERVLETGAGLALAAKFFLVILAVALASQRDFAQIARLKRALTRAEPPGGALSAIAWLDRIVLVLAAAVIYLGLAVSRA